MLNQLILLEIQEQRCYTYFGGYVKSLMDRTWLVLNFI